ncbi:MAG: hypothetical protein IJ494_06420 [Bacteroides sp.]|nr:hypothetical protein [Bacteroides sp.]
MLTPYSSRPLCSLTPPPLRSLTLDRYARQRSTANERSGGGADERSGLPTKGDFVVH